jgi:16S rRNA (guanine527-N7)-methyltransferase
LARPSFPKKVESFEELLSRHFFAVRPLSENQIALLHSHYQLLMRWNRVLNLTSIGGLEEVVVRHYCESLFLGAQLPPEAVSILDVGSGGGFPGIPIAVLRPDCQVVLAESHQRKAVFLREATRGWSNVRVESRRAEEVGGEFEWVVSRAVRWEPIISLVQRHVGLLVSEEDAQAAVKASGFTWAPLVWLPWGRHRVLLVGTKTSVYVPRGICPRGRST